MKEGEAIALLLRFVNQEVSPKVVQGGGFDVFKMLYVSLLLSWSSGLAKAVFIGNGAKSI